MADTKITALTALTAADPANDVLPIVDVSDTTMAASGTTKKISVNNILGASGTATLASATITGDLTVDTSTLKVDSANNRVGIGTASPNGPLDVQANTAATAISIRGRVSSNVGTLRWFQNNGTTETAAIESYDTGFEFRTLTAVPSIFIINSSERYRIASDGVATWSNVGGVAGTAMTLNSTGLGIGVGPSYPFHLRNSAAAIGMIHSTNANGPYVIFQNSTANFGDIGSELSITGGGSAGNMTINSRFSSNLCFSVSDTVRMRIDSSGNVGIGVTPSAWASNRRALQVGGLAAAALALNGTSNVSEMFFNSFINTSASNVYAVNGRAGLIDFGSGGFGFSIDSGTQTAGAACNFTRAMTLESTGSLVLGAAAVATTATDGFLYIPGCAGTPTGTPTAKTGRVPLVVDTTNNKLYFYSGGAWVAAN